MLGSNNQNLGGHLYVLKVKTADADKKKLDAPIFEVSEKGEDGKWKVTKTVAAVSGRLSKIDVKSHEWEGEVNYTASLFLKDDEANESYLIDLRIGNILNRGILNSILNVDASKEVKIALYQSKKGYPAGSVRQGDSLVDWKYGLDELPPTKEVIFKGKVMRDYQAIDEFFIKNLKEFSISSNSETGAKKEKAVKVEKSALDGQPQDSDLF